MATVTKPKRHRNRPRLADNTSHRFIADGPYDQKRQKQMAGCQVFEYTDGHCEYGVSTRVGTPELIDDSLDPRWYTVVSRVLFERWSNHEITDQQFIEEGLANGKTGNVFRHTDTIEV